MTTRIQRLTSNDLIDSFDHSKTVVLRGSDITETALSSQDTSFTYSVQDSALKNTQQLNVDWSKFEEHTFFSSAVVNINSAFDRVINGYPFDGTRSEVEQFFEKMTGFEKWVFDQFPKYRGQLKFDSTLESHISVVDAKGAIFPNVSRPDADGSSTLNIDPRQSMTIEFHIFVPAASNVDQVIVQKMSDNLTSPVGFVISLSFEALTTTCPCRFTVVDGSNSLTVTGDVTKGRFNHILAEYDCSATQTIGLTIDDKAVVSTSTTSRMSAITTEGYPLTIGSGSAWIEGIVTYTPTSTLEGVLDEFRIFKSIRTNDDVSNNKTRSIYTRPDLTLYFKFNEPPPPILPTVSDPQNAIVLDCSGNSLHSSVTNFSSTLRIESSTSPYGDAMPLEKEKFCPILFPSQTDVVSLNTSLIATGSLYDSENPNLITRLVPEHYFLEGQSDQALSTVDGTIVDTYTGTTPRGGKLGSSQLLMSLLYVYAREFDELKMYADAMSSTQHVDYDKVGTSPDTFLHRLLQQRGFTVPPMFSHSTIEQYIDSDNLQYPISSGDSSLKSIQNDLLRRLLTNLPAIIRSKGTQYSIKAFLRTLGIDPENSCRVREYGGPSTLVLGASRDTKHEVGSMTDLGGSNTLAVSQILSASRVEVGFPYAAGSFVDVSSNPPHGISDNPDDGLLTSGSWTVESRVRFKTATSHGTDSIIRMTTLGSGSMSTGLVANLVSTSGSQSVQPQISLFVRPGFNPADDHLELTIPVDVYDTDIWSVSFGRSRNDSISSCVSSSYFLRAAKTIGGSITEYYTSSSFFNESLSSTQTALSHIQSNFNDEGIRLSVGENQSFLFGTSSPYVFLNNTVASNKSLSRTLRFSGLQSGLKFWSKDLTNDEWKEHVRNYRSSGVIDPIKNYCQTTSPTGSFERLRLDTFENQDEKTADSFGSITFIDMSGNELHLSASGYTPSSRVVLPQMYDFSYISPSYDEPSTDEKVRPRGFLSQTNIDENIGSSSSPVYYIDPSERPTDDVRLSVDFSLIDALNRDIITIFSTLDSLDDALGSVNTMFSDDFPDLDRLRDLYFKRLVDKLNFKAFHEFFKFFDMSISSFIEQLIPKKTRFKGVNFVIEPHMIERSKVLYHSEGMYLTEGSRTDFENALLLQQIAGTLGRF